MIIIIKIFLGGLNYGEHIYIRFNKIYLVLIIFLLLIFLKSVQGSKWYGLQFIYNIDEKVAVMDTIDEKKIKNGLINLNAALNGRDVDYMSISHFKADV